MARGICHLRQFGDDRSTAPSREENGSKGDCLYLSFCLVLLSQSLSLPSAPVLIQENCAFLFSIKYNCGYFHFCKTAQACYKTSEIKTNRRQKLPPNLIPKTTIDSYSYTVYLNVTIMSQYHLYSLITPCHLMPYEYISIATSSAVLKL